MLLEYQPMQLDAESFTSGKEFRPVPADGRTDELTRLLLFPDQPLLGRLFTMRPLAIAMWAFGAAIVVLDIPAYLLGIHSIPTPNGNVGFWHKWNWIGGYTLGAPIWWAIGILVFRQMRTSVFRLIDPPPKVIADKNEDVALDFPESLRKRFRTHARSAVFVAAIVTLIVVGLDTYDLWPGFFQRQGFPASRVPEWDTAFRIPSLGEHAPKWYTNFAFDIVAYAFEAAIIFLGIFYVIKFLLFCKQIADVVDDRVEGYIFRPLISDYHKRLGLSSLAWSFNLFFVIAVTFSLFTFLHRLQQVDLHRGNPPGTYLSAIITSVGRKASPTEFLRLTSADCALDTLANPSTWVPVLFILFPLAVVSYFPLYHIWWYISKAVNDLVQAKSADREAANNRGDVATMRLLDLEINALNESSEWPNGNTAGWVFILALVAFFAGSVFPPFLVYLAISGILTKLVISIRKKFAGPAVKTPAP